MTRSLRVVFALLVAGAAACTGGSADQLPQPRSFAEIACSLPHRELVRTIRGYHPQRSGEIQFVPREPNFIGEFRSHSGPWDYVQKVPIFFYGPGHVPAAGRVPGRATMADIAPTLAAHLDFDFPSADGRVLEEAVEPSAPPPKLVVVVVWDGAGRNVLAEHPQAWPVLRSLVPDGVWYEDAVDGSSPSVTPSIHATLGTGAFPSHHGLVDLRLRTRDRLILASELGPRFLLRPTLADAYDRAHGNEPLVGTVALDEWHLAMTGKGARFPGGDRDLVALWNTLELRSGWELLGPESRAFALPPYLADFPGLEEEVRRVDLADGVLDGFWREEAPLADAGDVLASPAYSPWQTMTLETLIEHEGFGADQVPDILLTNYKQVDRVSHLFGMETPLMADVVRSSDQALGDLIEILNREVGEGQWVIALTADHGSTPPPSETGAFLIDRNRLKDDIDAAFDDEDGDKLVQAPRITEFWFDTAELDENGFTLGDVARFLMRYTKGQNARDPTSIPEEARDDRVFAAAFPSRLIDRGLPCLREP
jgi:hypothetical protein